MSTDSKEFFSFMTKEELENEIIMSVYDYNHHRAKAEMAKAEFESYLAQYIERFGQYNGKTIK